MGPKEEEVLAIAKVCHEANKAYCESINDFSQPSWAMAPEWQKTSAKLGVMFHLEHADSKPSDSHANWSKVKVADGWVYGEVKDPDAKPPTHPCLVPFEQLPKAQQMKDFIFHGIVHAMNKGFNS